MGYNESMEKCKEFFFKVVCKKREWLFLYFIKKLIKLLFNVLFLKLVCFLLLNGE